MENVNILVKSGVYGRQFTAKTFSIRNLITQIRRYNPDCSVLTMWYGDFKPDYISNERWRVLPEHFRIPNEINVTKMKEKEKYLENYDFRTATNLWYAKCCNCGDYPTIHPFKNVKRKGVLPSELQQYSESHYPLFVADDVNPYTVKDDILLHLDGYRIQKQIQGYDIAGYLIENNRYSTNKNE